MTNLLPFDTSPLDTSPFNTLPSVRELTSVLGASTLRLVSDPAGFDLAVTHLVLHDPWAGTPPARHGLLLGLGVRPDSAHLDRLFEESAAVGFNAVAIKAYGADPGAAAVLADGVGIALLLVPDDLEWLHLEKLLSTALDGARTRVSPELSSLAVGDLFSLAGAIATATGGATTIEDPAARVLAYSTDPSQVIDEERREGILGRQVPELLGNASDYRQLHASTEPIRLASHTGGLERLAVAVRSGAELLGSIWVVDAGDGSLSDRASQVLSESAEIAALHLLRHRSSEDFARQHRIDLVERVLRDGDLAAAGRLGLSSTTRVAVVAVEATSPQPDVDPARLLGVLSLEIESRVPGAGCVAHLGRVYGVLPVGSRGEGTVERLMADVVAGASRAVRNDLRAAVGPSVASPAAAAQSREAADQVLAVLHHRPDLGPVRSSADLADQITLLAMARADPGAADLSALAAAALTHDSERGTAYAPLLLAWLDSGRDVRATAQAMQLHPNTVRYRLERCRQLLGLRDQDPDQVVLAWLALRIARLTGRLG